MALLDEYKGEQTNNPSMNVKHKIYQAYKDEHNKNMQDVKHKCERDKQSQTREICFEVRAHLLYIFAFNTMKDFH